LGEASLDQFGGRRSAPHDQLGFRAHLAAQTVDGGSIEAAKAHQKAAHDFIRHGRAQEADR
jgi:hypothetical protein